MSALKRYFLPALLIFVMGTAVGLTMDGLFSDDTYEQLQKLEDAYILINRQYVEEVDPAEMTEQAIQAMLKELDPHSSYIDTRSMTKVQADYQGSFGGIGIWFEAPANDTTVVTSTIPDGPSEAAGLLPGDRIIAVNDSSIIGLTSLDIQNLIMGPVGTDVDVTVVRRRVTDSINFGITRAKIPLYSIDSSYMLDDQTGFLRIGRFAMTTHQEFVEKVSELKAQGMKRLIIDLRGNPGGIKQTAVMVADEMLGGTGVIVSTEGRVERENEVDQITAGGILTEESVMILVDESSASGSEILAGALQDHDRAMIVGRRTFGKGLVQRPFQMRDGSVIQMTVARYFMPSGRLIQTPYADGDLEDYYRDKFEDMEQATYNPAEYLSEIPDSLKFKTANGRDVFGGGGVMPDRVIAPDSTSALSAPIVQNSIARGYAFLFMRNLFDIQGEELRSRWVEDQDGFLSQFKVDPAMWQDYLQFAQDEGLPIGEGEDSFSMDEVNQARSTMETIIKARMAQRLFRSEAWYPVFNQMDPVIEEAMLLWSEANSINSLGN
ncbi:MAG: S41 family peptidase [Bacteroidetes Order II. Incertae sedis bacterium]|nr:S41 family peptidase [Bacteroidetes Order II. bacterium]